MAPQHGLYTAIVAGLLIPLLGGSHVQVSGPTAAFVVVLAPIATRFGVGGLLLATVMAGVLLIALGLARAGSFIEFVPYPVTTGFTAGIAVVIATLQLKDLLGLTVTRMPEHFLERLGAIAEALPTTHAPDVMVGLSTLAVLILWPRRWGRRVPAPLVALRLGAAVAWPWRARCPTSGWPPSPSRFSYEVHGVVHGGIPRQPPLPVLPWTLPGPDGQPLASPSTCCARSSLRPSRSPCWAPSSRCSRRSSPTA